MVVGRCVGRYTYEEVGEVPMKFIVRKPIRNLTEEDVMEFFGR